MAELSKGSVSAMPLEAEEDVPREFTTVLVTGFGVSDTADSDHLLRRMS